MSQEKIIRVARGEEKADLVIKNARIINVLSEEIHQDDVAIVDGIIAGVGENYEGYEEIDIQGKFLSPSFIDGHVHIESSMLLPNEFAKAVVPAGTTTVIIDPHEISNVLGLHGISFMHEAVKGLPLNVYTMLPSCVPATPFETSGFELNSYDLSLLIDSPWVLGVAEMMNFPGVLSRDKDVMAKLELAKSKNKRIDGHAPLVTGKELCAYIASGITSDHECTDPQQAIEKLRQGMYIMVREGTAAKDLEALMPILQHNNNRKIMFVTDDRHPADLLEHINYMVRVAVANGVNPIKAIQMASLNTAEYFKIQDLGAIAPGYRADLLVLDDLQDFKPTMVFKDGKKVAENGNLIITLDDYEVPSVRGSVNVGILESENFKIRAFSDIVQAIETVPNQLITKQTEGKINVVNGFAESNTDEDILKIVVIERHKASGNIGKGFVKGFGLKTGAMASTVAHDSHNMIIIGTNDEDMLFAANELVKSQGGKVVVENGQVLAKLELPIAGLISNKDFDFVIEKYFEIKEAAKAIGCVVSDPFMTMAFLSLPVIPELKITDKGIFTTNGFKFIDIFERQTIKT